MPHRHQRAERCWQLALDELLSDWTSALGRLPSRLLLRGSRRGCEESASCAWLSQTKFDSKGYLRNDETVNAVAAYVVRARPVAPVSVPIDWKQLNALKSGSAFGMTRR
jgi:hypothetical protein